MPLGTCPSRPSHHAVRSPALAERGAWAYRTHREGTWKSKSRRPRRGDRGPLWMDELVGSVPSSSLLGALTATPTHSSEPCSPQPTTQGSDHPQPTARGSALCTCCCPSLGCLTLTLLAWKLPEATVTKRVLWAAVHGSGGMVMCPLAAPTSLHPSPCR